MLTDMKVKMYDVTGQKCSSTFHMAAGADPALQSALLTALDGISSGGILGIQAAYHDNTPGDAAVDGPYATAEDKLLLNFEGANGSNVTVTIPAPDEACFNADGETLDLGVIGADIDALEAQITDTAGNAVTFVGGKRIWNRRKKR